MYSNNFLITSSVAVTFSFQISNGSSEYRHKENMLIISEMDRVFSVLPVHVNLIKIILSSKDFF